MENITKGGFTLPGEAGYEELTLKLAEKWGADVIRDSDGTVLSDEILNAGYDIHSTICLIRDHNDWASENADKLQQSFLVTQPLIGEKEVLEFHLMDDFFNQQFTVNESLDSLKYWQVYDRTLNKKIDSKSWYYEKETQSVIVKDVIPWHKYTVSFLAYRIWEEISMYNHTTNNWDKEHLMQIDPRYPETQQYLTDWMIQWCESHENTNVVRFTSMFYNFVWMWGSSEKNRHLFTDWASYDFTVSPLALDLFAEKYGYTLTAEDFINKGDFHVTHMPADQHKRDWMEFVNDFIITFGKKLIQIVHDYGKKAYVFYDDSWVGIEPYNGRFEEFGFDGMIKAVFSGFESRLCSGVNVETHELRMHPYLFPVGVDGSPSFLADGNPTLEAKKYWQSVRRAILRAPIERLGLGGYLHLTERKPDFSDYIEKLANEFRKLRQLHQDGTPYVLKPRVAVLHCWGRLRSWTLSGHFHETYMHDLIHINESLSGLPFEVSFLDFEDVKQGALKEIDVVINAGYAGSAWSGGEAWAEESIVTLITQWVYEGGAFIGVNEPSAIEGYDTYFRMAHVLGIDEDTGAKICHGRWQWEIQSDTKLFPEKCYIRGRNGLYLTDGKAKVLAEDNGMPSVTVNAFGKGKGVYLSSFEMTDENTRFLMNLILYAAGENIEQEYVTSNPCTECAYYPQSKTLVVINNTEALQKTSVKAGDRTINCEIEGYDILIRTIE